MAKHLLRDLENLKKEILMVGSMVEEATHKSILALFDRRGDLADEVVAGDRHIDEKEVQLDEECLKVLALHQPVATDLRFVVTVMKVNNDLERVGDLAKNIAQRAQDLVRGSKNGGADGVTVPPGIREMADHVRIMLRDALNSLVQMDTTLARSVLERDETVDALHAGLFTTTQDRIREDITSMEIQIQLLSVSRYLERMADQATNIAEDVVFLVEGEVIRHLGH